MKAVILAAGVGSRLAPITDSRPKALVEVRGRSLVLRQLDHLAKAGIAGEDVIVVGGYRIDMLRDALAPYRCNVVENEKYQEWGNFFSLMVAAPHVAREDFLQIDGDVVLDDKILPRMLAAPGEALIAVDRSAVLDDDAMKVALRGEQVIAVSKQADPKLCAGEYIGVTRLSVAAARAVFAELQRFIDEQLTHEYYDTAYHRLSARGDVPFGIVDVSDCRVLEIDDHADLRRAEETL